jgi:lipoate-protein ligase A
MKAVVIETPPFDVYEQMSCDEIMLQNPLAGFVLRVYNWKEKAITFGYAQNCDYVIKNIPPELKNANFTRRTTGGGVVFHDEDFTFSCIFENKQNFKIPEIYFKLHKSICAALCERKIFCKLSGDETDTKKYAPTINKIPSQCFINPVKHDVLDSNGNKILGGALRLFGNTVLYQGSLRVMGVRKKISEFKLAIMKALTKNYSTQWQVYKLQGKKIKPIKELAKNKYNSGKWIYKL